MPVSGPVSSGGYVGHVPIRTRQLDQIRRSAHLLIDFEVRSSDSLIRALFRAMKAVSGSRRSWILGGSKLSSSPWRPRNNRTPADTSGQEAGPMPCYVSGGPGQSSVVK